MLVLAPPPPEGAADTQWSLEVVSGTTARTSKVRVCGRTVRFMALAKQTNPSNCPHPSFILLSSTNAQIFSCDWWPLGLACLLPCLREQRGCLAFR